jgi:hypothetical protein
VQCCVLYVQAIKHRDGCGDRVMNRLNKERGMGIAQEEISRGLNSWNSRLLDVGSVKVGDLQVTS